MEKLKNPFDLSDIGSGIYDIISLNVCIVCMTSLLDEMVKSFVLKALILPWNDLKMILEWPWSWILTLKFTLMLKFDIKRTFIFHIEMTLKWHWPWNLILKWSWLWAGIDIDLRLILTLTFNTLEWPQRLTFTQPYHLICRWDYIDIEMILTFDLEMRWHWPLTYLYNLSHGIPHCMNTYNLDSLSNNCDTGSYILEKSN